MVAVIPPLPPRFDRERIALYIAACTALALVTGFYLAGYLFPALDYGRAIVGAAQGDESFSAGCYLLFMEHANRIQSSYALRFLGMLMGIAVVFVGMFFTIKGLEAGYALDVTDGSKSASLKTASPGLVLCTLGLALIAAAVMHTANLTFETPMQCFVR